MIYQSVHRGLGFFNKNKSLPQCAGEDMNNNNLFFHLCRKHLTLAELLDIIDTADDSDIPDEGLTVGILPPTNCIDDLTDEDSGAEDDPTIDNLPGSQLRAEAIIPNQLLSTLMHSSNHQENPDTVENIDIEANLANPLPSTSSSPKARPTSDNNPQPSTSFQPTSSATSIAPKKRKSRKRTPSPPKKAPAKKKEVKTNF